MNSPFLVFLSGIAILGLIFWYFATDVDKVKRNIGTILILGIALLCLLAIRPPSFQKTVQVAAPPKEGEVVDPDAEPIFIDKVVSTLKPGIDLAGGAAYTLQVQPKIDDQGVEIPVTADATDKAIETLRGRLNPAGTRDMLIQRQGTDRIIIELPGVTEEEAASDRRRIEETAKLELRAVHPDTNTKAPQVKAGETIVAGYELFEYTYTNDDGEEFTEDLLLSKRVQVEGKHVKYAAPDSQQKGVVNIRLTGDGGDRMILLTKKMTPRRDRIAVVLDGEVKSAPVVNSVPLGSSFLIEGLDDYEEAKDLSSSLMNPLENPLKFLDARKVTARLGHATIEQGIYAGIAGLGLTLLFVLLYYRFGGLIALSGLAINILILFGAMAMFEFTFTLPGIAGIILTIGVAVDANVLIYERLREEMQEGKSLGAAIKAAYEKAFSAIFDANITTLITALILFWRASGTVKGFAVTLTIGILASMFAALVATRVMFWWTTGCGTQKGPLKKLSFLNLIPEKAIQFMNKRKMAFFLSGALLVGAIAIGGVQGNKALGIDFVGGSRVQFQIGDAEISAAEVKESLKDVDLRKEPIVQNESAPGTGNLLSIRCAGADIKNNIEGDEQKIIAELRKDIPVLAAKMANSDAYEIPDDTTEVSATLGSEFLINSIIALGIGLIAILIYITIRFEFSFAVGAFAALFHDLIICIGIIIASGFLLPSGGEISLIHVGAILTIAGYSINDTIVVFDRIRETLRMKRGEVEDVMNLAINATLSRTLLTSVTTFVAVLVLWIFGGPSLKAFSFAIMIGVVVGTYSSIFIASPIVLIWSRARGSNLRRELLDANLEAQVSPASGKA